MVLKLDELITALQEVRLRAQDLNPHQFLFGGSHEDLNNKLLVPVETLLDDVSALVEEIETRASDATDGASTPQTTSVEAAMVRDGMERAIELCFGARVDIGQTRRRLALIHDVDREDQLDICESICRRVRRFVARLLEEPLLAQTEFSTEYEDESELENAIAVRRAYAKFRESLRTAEIADTAELRRALSRAAIAIGRILSEGAFMDIRIRDKALFLSLQQRVVEWFERNDDMDEGKRLYGDLRATGDLIRGVNLRQELKEYDKKVVEETKTMLSREASEDELPTLLARLSTMEGRDDELDSVLTRARSLSSLAPLRLSLISILGRLEDPADQA